MGTNDASPDCPECGEPIGARASYCMHCGAEFGDEGPESGGDESGGIDDAIGSVMDSIDGSSDQAPDVDHDPASVDSETSQDPTATADASTADTGTADMSTTDASTTDGASGTGAGTSTGTGDGDGTEETAPLDPDSLIDNSLTVVVGIGAGIVIGLISLFVFGIAFGGTGVLLAFVAWLGSTAYLSRRRTVFDAVRDGAFGLAIVLVIAGVGASVGTVLDGNSVVSALVVVVPFVFFAFLVAGTGYAIGTLGVE